MPDSASAAAASEAAAGSSPANSAASVRSSPPPMTASARARRSPAGPIRFQPATMPAARPDPIPARDEAAGQPRRRPVLQGRRAGGGGLDPGLDEVPHQLRERQRV